MKKLIITATMMAAAVGLIMAYAGPSVASVSGPCVNCHTMHNSQGGAIMATGSTFGNPGYGSLTRDSCGGCHETTSTDPLSGGYPRVKLASASDTNQLAGGYLSATSGQTDNHGNTEHSIGSTAVPSGYDSAGNYVGSDWYMAANGLKCAGSSGCHGSETQADPAAAIAGGHHANNLKGTFGYRMLAIGATAVVGTGAADYEKALNAAPSADDAHNFYSASTDGNGGTISRFCGKCHGKYHNTTDIYVSNSWVRHPADRELNANWEIMVDRNTNYTANDWKSNPVGTGNAVDPLSGAPALLVTCLSCHRAHGSAYSDALRFDYSAQIADGGGTTGCLGCHDKQR